MNEPDEKGRRLAGKIHLTSTPDGGWHLLIDGAEFPWCVLANSVKINDVDPSEMPGVTLTLLADQVTVDHNCRRAPVGQTYGEGPMSMDKMSEWLGWSA